MNHIQSSDLSICERRANRVYYRSVMVLSSGCGHIMRPSTSLGSNALFTIVLVACLLGCQSDGFQPSALSKHQWPNFQLHQQPGEAASTEKYIKFYSLEGGMCPYAARTWIALLELGLPFELIEVDARKKEQWYLDINPRGKVPAIQNLRDGTVIYESAICDEYLSDYARQLDGSFPPSSNSIWRLSPLDAGEKAAMRLLNDHIDTQLGPAQFTFLMNEDKEKDSEMKDKLEDALIVLQTALESRGGPYLMGEKFSLADVHVLPFFLRLEVSLKHFKDYEIPPTRFATLLKWYELCSERDSVKAASKPDEKIIEVYQKFVDIKYNFGGLNNNK